MAVSNLSRWEPLAKNLMSEIGLSDNAVVLEVIERALSQAYQVGAEEFGKEVFGLEQRLSDDEV